MDRELMDPVDELAEKLADIASRRGTLDPETYREMARVALGFRPAPVAVEPLPIPEDMDFMEALEQVGEALEAAQRVADAALSAKNTAAVNRDRARELWKVLSKQRDELIFRIVHDKRYTTVRSTAIARAGRTSHATVNRALKRAGRSEP